MRWLASIVAAALILAPASAAIAQDTGTIRGTVTDSVTGKPLAGAQVYIVGTKTGQLTSPDGRFVLVDIPPGEVHLQAQMLGYPPVAHAVTVPAGSMVTVDFALKPERRRIEFGDIRRVETDSGIRFVLDADSSRIRFLPRRNATPNTHLVQNVRFTFQVVEADGPGATDPAIAHVVDEMRRLFRFEGYHLLDTSVLMGTPVEPSATLRQEIALPGHGMFYLQALPRYTTDPEAIRVTVNLLDAARQQMTGAGEWKAPEVLNVSVNVRDGQTIILGSARDQADAGAIILVMKVDFDPDGM